MAGIYVHIPFCRKYCSYCDFYRVKSVQDLPRFIEALEMEVGIRCDYLGQEEIESLYFGGGTPSLLGIAQINRIVLAIIRNHNLAKGCEITLECNPDDLNRDYLMQLKDHTPVNRLSIGIQSFSPDDLKLLNRRHNARQSISCLEDADVAGFRNISIDLIYGLPGMALASWQKNLKQGFSYGVPHISAYHLTLERGTSLYRRAEEGTVKMPAEDESHAQYMMLCNLARERGYSHYEVSNLCLDGYEAIHNTGYWQRKKYLGLGPSAHSYDMDSRQWNISDTGRYIQAMRMKRPEYTRETLDLKKNLNETLMLSLRTQQGISLKNIKSRFGQSAASRFTSGSAGFVASGHMLNTDGHYTLTEEAWFISDHIISRLLV